MHEPTLTTSGAPVSVGLLALLVGAFGPVAADVMMVVISALAGCFIALSALKEQTLFQSVRFVVMGVLVSLALSWALAGVLTSWIPALSGPYTPSIIAMFIGFSTKRLPQILSSLVDKAETKAGLTQK